MIKRLFFASVLSLWLLALPSLAQADEIRQWASSAEASTEYSSTSWSADRATGAPDVLACGDSGDAWASAEVTDDETLTVYFDTPVAPSQINIHQSYNPGAIVAIELIPSEGDFTIPIPNSADTSTKCPGVFSLDISMSNSTAIHGVIIRLDQTKVGNWNEIDAVELVGTPLGNTSGPGGGPGSGNTAPQPTSVPVPEGPAGMSVTCPNGRVIENGVKVTIVQMRTGFDYTATAIGINGFDPVLAVLDPNGRAALCNDDEFNASAYSAELPTTGFVPSSTMTSQVTFSNNGGGFSDVSLVVGGFNEGEVGEYLLVLEGMAYTSADAYGDPFSIEITPGMLASDIDPTIYMVSITNRLDPFIAVVDYDGNYITDDKGNLLFSCDDAGTTSCYGESSSMSGMYVSRTANRYLGGYGYDSMLTLPVGAEDEWVTVPFLMASAEFSTFGDYLVAFHIGIDNPATAF